MSYWYWSGGVALVGLVLGTLLFFIAYWRGRRRARQEKMKARIRGSGLRG